MPKVAAQARADSSSRAGDAGAQGKSEAPPRVLLIEDEPGIVDFVRRGLEAEGFAVEAALDGTEGERLALSGSFDAIVLDLMLPGRSGLDILALLRKGESKRAGDRADRPR